MRSSAAEIPKILILRSLRTYKWALSPLLPPACKYVPTCSEYAAEAVDRHGALGGLLLAIGRVLRCHPFVRGGFDPVPLEKVSRSRQMIAKPRSATQPRTAVAPARATESNAGI
jgi:uncharacterized protein